MWERCVRKLGFKVMELMSVNRFGKYANIVFDVRALLLITEKVACYEAISFPCGYRRVWDQEMYVYASF